MQKSTLIDEIFGSDADLVRRRGSWGPRSDNMTKALEQLGLHPMERLAMRGLLDCRYRLDPVQPGIRDIAAILGRSYRQAWEWLQRLELRGLVKIERRRGKKSLFHLGPFIVALRKLLGKRIEPVKGVLPVMRPERETLHAKKERELAARAPDLPAVKQVEMPPAAEPEPEEDLPLYHFEAKQHWQEIKEQIRPKVSSSAYLNFVDQSMGYAIKDGELYVLVNSSFTARHLEIGLGATVKLALLATNSPYKVRFFTLATVPKKSWLQRAAEFMGQSAASFL